MRRKKFLSLLMAIFLLLSMLPTTALAAGNAMDFDLELSGKTQGLKANDEITCLFHAENHVVLGVFHYGNVTGISCRCAS